MDRTCSENGRKEYLSRYLIGKPTEKRVDGSTDIIGKDLKEICSSIGNSID